MYNKTEMIGFLGSDAKIRDVAENRKVITLRVATTAHYLSNGQPAEHTEWFNVESFCSDKQADYFSRHARKGALVHASGETRTQTWTDADGNEHSKAVVLVHVGDLQILKPPASHETSQPAAQKPKPERAKSHPPLPAADARGSDSRMDLMDFPD